MKRCVSVVQSSSGRALFEHYLWDVTTDIQQFITQEMNNTSLKGHANFLVVCLSILGKPALVKEQMDQTDISGKTCYKNEQRYKCNENAILFLFKMFYLMWCVLGNY